MHGLIARLFRAAHFRLALASVAALAFAAMPCRTVAAGTKNPSLDALYKAIGKEDYAEAKRLADALLPTAQGAERKQLLLTGGRILLGLKDREAAREYLAAMAKETLDGDGPRLMRVYTAWLDALDGSLGATGQRSRPVSGATAGLSSSAASDPKTDAAIKTLEAMLKENVSDAASAEAADVLALLYMARGDNANAQRAVDFGLGVIKYQELKTPYIEKLLRGRLKSKATASDSEKLYLAAEKLRQQGKFADAGRQFMLVWHWQAQSASAEPHGQTTLARGTQSVWSAAAGFRIGQCFQGLNRTPEAIDHWKKFVADSPAGPWRGQARVELFDLALETNFDLAAASEQAATATATLAGILSAPRAGEAAHSLPLPPGEGRGEGLDAAPSWHEAALDIHLRQGMVSLLESRYDAAALAFQQAKRALPKVAGKLRVPSAPVGVQPSGWIGQAKAWTPTSVLLAGLDRLIAAAEQKASLIPADVALHGNPQTQLILAFGQINLLVDQPATAQKLFMAALTEPKLKGTPAERAFAALGLARSYVALAVWHGPAQSARASFVPVAALDPSPSGRGQGEGLAHLDLAKTLYQRSLKEYPSAPWHDETLRELALLIERVASSQFSVVSGKKPAADKLPRPPGEGRGEGAATSDSQRQQQAKALAAARAEALPYWLELVKRFSAVKSPRVPQALYHAGLLLTEAENRRGLAPFAETKTKNDAAQKVPVPLSAGGSSSDEAISVFTTLVQKYTDSPYTPDAQVRLIDVKLEQQFDLPGAATLADAAVTWCDQIPLPPRERLGEGARDAVAAPNLPLPPGEGLPAVSLPNRAEGAPTDNQQLTTDNSAFSDDTLPPLRDVQYNIYLRAGLIAYLQEQKDAALEFFKKAEPLQPERSLVVVQGHIPTGIERLIGIAQRRESQVPEDARRGDEKARLILTLADLYQADEQYQKSIDLCEQVIMGSFRKATREQRSWALFQRGRDHFRIYPDDVKDDSNATLAEADYMAAYQLASRSTWADQALLLTANIRWNYQKDASGAIVLWRKLLAEFPKSSDADRAAFYVGVAFEWSDRPKDAVQAYAAFLKAYPSSRFAEGAKGHMDDLSRQPERKP